ncbi:MAG TPA: GAF domain-containing sensor histidine kinase [Bryobacteraceae bacterium]|jgi:signal transduction histidine kinase/GAF domain-containing protein
MAAENETKWAQSMVAVVQTGLAATQMSGIQDILKSVASEFSAFGCVLWEASPGSILTPQRREGSFFALAQWFENGSIWRQHDIPVQSGTGYAITHGLPSYAIEDVSEHPECYKADFLKGNKILRVCIVPLRFVDRAVGSLNLYRLDTQPPFSKAEEERIAQIAGLIPSLYETVRDEVAYRCSRAVNDLLQRAAQSGTSDDPRQRSLLDVTQKFCAVLKDNLRCFDVSVYLEEEDKPGVYVLYGSTLPDTGITTTSYKKGDTNPAACVLTYGRPIRILDLQQPKTYPPGIAMEPPNLKYVEYVLREVTLDPKSPLSFMATPILAGERLLGVLRCCVPLDGPTYFAERDADLLMLLAGQIGHYVSDQRSRREVHRESQSYKVIIDSITSISDLAYTELSRSKPNEDRVLEQCLGGIAQALPGEQWIGIAVRSAAGVYKRRNMQSSFSGTRPKDVVGLPPGWERELSLGHGILKHRSDLEAEGSRVYTSSLPHVPNGALLAPVQSRDESWFLEIVNSGPGEFPKHAKAIAELLGKQLGIYHDLFTTIVQLTHAKGELQVKIDQETRAAKAQAQAMMDLEHQIRAPLRHARRRMPGLLKLSAAASNPPLNRQLLHLRGNLRRAGRVAGNARLFSRLASGQPIECSLESWTYEDIRLLLIEAAMDNTAISDESRGITFGVDEESFSKLQASGKVTLDKDLLDQALNDLLDNAGKYSDPNTHVKIEVQLSKAYFAISITNKGLKIPAGQVETVKERGQRGAIAQLAAGEGSGIGLWIANEIMKAHGGHLDIIPTTPERMTRIRMMFPITRG